MSIWPASSLRAISSRQPAKTSTHAWIVHCARAERVDGELARPADAVVVGVERRQRRLAATPLAVALDSARRRAGPRGRRGRRRPRRRRSSPTVRLTGQRPSSIVGPDELDADARRGRLGSRRGGHVSALFPICSVPNVTTMDFHAIQRRPAAPDLAAGRPAWTAGLSVRRLARGCGAGVVAGAAAGSARSGAVTVQGPLGFRGLAGVARRPLGAGRRRRGRRVPGEARRLDRGLGGIRRRTRAVNDQVRFDREWAALRSYAADRGVRLIGDVPIYVAPGSADHEAHPELFREDVVAGAPPDYFTEKGQLWGNPIYDWPALRRRGYRFWIERFRRDVRPLRPRAGRPLPRLRGLLGDPARRPRRAPGALGPRAGARAVRRGAGGARRPPDHRRGPRRHHAASRPAARRARLPGHGRPPVRASTPTTPTARTTSSATASTRSSTPARTTTTRCAAGTRACPRSASPCCARRACAAGSPWWDLIALAQGSLARLCMLQVQDVLGLGNEARMNLPGTASGNWRSGWSPGS